MLHKIKKRVFVFFICCSLFCSTFVNANTLNETKKDTIKDNTTSDSAPVNVTSKSAVLIEGSTGEIIYEKNKDEQLIPASITKIMSLILIFDAIDSGKITLTDQVPVSEHAASMGGSQVYLEPNETQTVDEMIKCISIASANDACVAMAEFVAGSESEFVNRMNERAKELGMKNTHFMNCNGLDDDITSGHYSSAYDVAIMSRELITKHPEISKYSTTWMDKITHVTKKGESEFGLTNTNKLVRFYKGITGLKTGSTSKAKYCLSATANRNGMDLIAVVMAAQDPKTRFSEAASLLDYGFANCSLYKDEQTDLVLNPVPIKGGIVDEITIRPEKPFTYTCLKGESMDKVTKNVVINEKIAAPVTEGAIVGSLEYSLNGKPLGSVNLVSNMGVEKASFVDYFFKLTKRLFLG